MKKKKLLTLTLSVFSILALCGCSSSNTTTGDSTATCQKGETGEKGDKGDTGEKGETGEKGDKGDTGEKGETGPAGETTYACTIINSDDGYVKVDVGSALVGQEVTFTVVPYSNIAVLGLKLNDTTVYEADLTKMNNGTYTYKTAMVKNGFVVEGLFIGNESKVQINVADYDEADLIAMQGSAIVLPTVTATDRHDNDISGCLSVSDADDVDAIFDAGTVQSEKAGDHHIKFAIKNPSTQEVINEKTVVVTFARDLIDWSDNTFSVENAVAKDSEQYIKSTNTGFGLCRLKFGYATDYYYEVEVNRADVSKNYAFGLACYKQDSNEPLTFAFEGNDNNFKVKKFNTSGDGSWSFNDSTLDFLNYQLGNYRSTVDIEKSPGKYTMGVLRRGNVYYVFVNGGYAFQYQSEEFGTEGTCPGFVTYNPNDGVTMHNIKYIADAEELATKEEELLAHGSKQIGAYTAGGADWANGSLADGNFTVNPYSEEKGLNFTFNKDNTGYNDGMVSLYQQFVGDFTFEFDYKPTSISAGDESFMWLELRYGKNYDEAMEFGTKFGGSDATELSASTIEQMSKNKAGSGEKWANEGVVDFAEGFHYSLSRKIVSDGLEAEFTLVVSSIATPDQVKTVTYTNSATMRLLPLWHNRHAAGEYSHIAWKFEA